MKYALTPFPPRAIVEITALNGDMAIVCYLNKHGEKPAGSVGGYYTRDLIPVPEKWLPFIERQVQLLDETFALLATLASDIEKELTE